MIRLLTAILALGTSCLPAVAADLRTTTEEADSSSMRFAWHAEGPIKACREACHTWISAAGIITENTARDFELFAKRNNIHGATLALDSIGGSVLAALELGRAIRRFEMTTTVGKTIALPPRGKAGFRLSPVTSCESMCAFVLLGGKHRYVPPQARVLVHMIWLANKRDRAQEASYSAEELGLVQQNIGSIARYTVEMGGGIELLETALRVRPWEPMYALTTDEVRRMRLNTLESLFNGDIAPFAAAAE